MPKFSTIFSTGIVITSVSLSLSSSVTNATNSRTICDPHPPSLFTSYLHTDRKVTVSWTERTGPGALDLNTVSGYNTVAYDSVLDSEEDSKLKVPFKIYAEASKPNQICQFLLDYRDDIIDTVSIPFLTDSLLSVLEYGFCEPCLERCELKCKQITVKPDFHNINSITGTHGSSRVTCKFVMPSVSSRCVTVSRSYDDLKSSLFEVENVRTSWGGSKIDLWWLFFCTYSIGIYIFSEEVARSAIVHAFFGAIFGIPLSGIMTAAKYVKLDKAISASTEKMGRNPKIWSVIGSLNVVIARYIWLRTDMSFTVIESLLDRCNWLDHPSLPCKSIYLILSIPILTGMYLGQQFFYAEDVDVSCGDVPFHIAENGARIDDVPEQFWEDYESKELDGNSIPRRCLRHILKVTSLWIVWNASTSPTVNILMVMVLCNVNRIIGWYEKMKERQLVFAASDSDEAAVGKPMGTIVSSEKYNEQAKNFSNEQLRKLREHLQSEEGQKEIAKIEKAKHEFNVRKFIEGESDIASIHKDTELVDKLKNMEKISNWRLELMSRGGS